MSIKRILLALFIAISATAAWSQLATLPRTTIGGVDFYYYQPGDDESLYGISKKLGISTDDIIKYNPATAEGVKSDMTLYFPVDEVDDAVAGVRHTVKQGETLYGLSRQYGISMDDLIAANPGTENGVSVGQELVIPGATATTTTVDDATDQQVRNAFSRSTTTTTTTPSTIAAPQTGEPVYHTLQAGESIYTLAKQYNASIEGILAANPGLEPSQYVTGEQVKVVPGSALPFQYERTGVRNYKYKVQRGETFASIAEANGITEQMLMDANPGMKKAKRGKTITLPRPYSERAMGEMATIPLDELQAYYEPRINDIWASVNTSASGNDINIAMVLPFQLHKSNPPKQAYLYTDFYKGFLLALDSASNITSKHVNVKVYDTQHNLNVTDSILALPELKDMHIIIAPSEPKQLQRINQFGRSAGVAVLNCFTTKNEDYRENPYVYQVNTPTDKLAQNVLKWFDNTFGSYNVIYLVENGGEGDKEIFEDFRNHIAATGQHATTIQVNGELTYNDISNQMNPGTRYIFIPSSGSKSLLKKTVKALKQVKKERFDCDMALIGYPEYVMYLKDHQTDLQDIDTYMFSRFFNAKGFRTRDIEARYKRQYGGEMLAAVPNMGLYGFDTGMYLLQALSERGRIDEHTPLYKGIQTSFKFERDNNWSGYTNQAIEVVHFSTDHKITVEVK